MRKSTLNRLVILCICAVSGINLFGQNAYITSGDSTVTVINTKNNTVITTINTHYDVPDGVVVSPDGSRAFITYFTFGHIISVINTSTNKIINTINIGTDGHGADGIDISPDGSKLYYSGFSYNGLPDTLFVVDTETGNTISKIIMPRDGIEGVAVTPNGNTVYVALFNLIVVINTNTNKISTTIDLGANVFTVGIAVSPDGSTVYTADGQQHKIVVVNTTTNTVETSIETGSGPGVYPYGVAVSPDGSRVYASNFAHNNVAVINAATNTLIDTLPVASKSYGLQVAPDGSKLYISNNSNGSGSLRVINTSNYELVADIPVGTLAVAFGKFIAAPPINKTSGIYKVTTGSAPVISDTFFNPLQKPNGELYAEVNPSNNTLGLTLWGARLYSGADIQNAYAWFGNSNKEYGAFLNNNIFITPANQPISDNIVRIYSASSDIKNFINTFNTQYGTSKTINDIRIIKYNGSNVDLDWTNNDDISSKYSSVTPSYIGYYGFTNEVRYFEFQVSSYSELWIALTSSNAVLPLHLTTFTGERLDNSAVLHWQTSSEENISHFDIERSNDGFKFTTINTVKASGNSLFPKNYSVTDINPYLPQSFYRLRIIDNDGQFAYSKIFVIKFDSYEALTIFPNPVKNSLNIKINSSIKSLNLITIVNANGKIIKTFPIAGNAIMSTSLDVSDLPKGIYIIIVENLNKQFIKL